MLDEAFVGTVVQDADGQRIGVVAEVGPGGVLEVATDLVGNGRRYWFPADLVRRVEGRDLRLGVMWTDLSLYERRPDGAPER